MGELIETRVQLSEFLDDVGLDEFQRLEFQQAVPRSAGLQPKVKYRSRS